MQEHERLDLDENNSYEEVYIVIRWSNYVATNGVFNDQIQWTWTTYFQPKIDSFEDIRILSEKDLLFGLGKTFFFCDQLSNAL